MLFFGGRLTQILVTLLLHYLTVGYKQQLKYINKHLIIGYKIIYNEYNEFNEFLPVISYSIFRAYYISDNWRENINVLKIVLKDISERIQIYTIINRPCLLMTKFITIA